MTLRRPIHFSAMVATAALLAACQGVPITGTKPQSVAAAQARWDALGVASYSYDFAQSGFFNACPTPVHVVVQGDSVVSATAMATGQPMAHDQLAMCAPTIEDLFQHALDAARRDGLAGIHYDPVSAYPLEVDISGPPDAGGSYFASGLNPLR